MSTTYRFDAFDRARGNGSTDSSTDWLDEQSIYTNEWGSVAATTFNPHEPDANGNPLPERKKQRMERWEDFHNGKGRTTRADEINKSHIQNDANTFLSVLELPQPQRDRVLLILDNLDISSNNFGAGRPYEKIILALCSLVADEALTDQPNPSIDDRLFLQDEFRELMDATEMSSSELRRIRAAIRERTDEFGNST